MSMRLHNKHLAVGWFVACLALISVATPVHAAQCIDGVLFADDGRSTLGTCSAGSQGTFTNVTCTDGALSGGGVAANSTCAPATAAQGNLLRDGVFGCNASKYANVGSITAVGGVYVPVNDAAVTLNTGYLVYKECVLDGVTAKVSESARTEAVRTITNDINTRRNGEALYRKNFSKELTDIQTALVVKRLQDQNYTGVMSSDFNLDVVRAYARRYSQSIQQPNRSFATTYPGSPSDFYRNNNFSYEGLLAMVDPCNSPYSNFEICFSPTLDSERGSVVEYQMQEWLEGRGFYAVTDNNDNPLLRQVLTPSSLVEEGATQVFTGGFRCLEGADELSEVCAPLFAGLSTQLIGGQGGLANLDSPVAGLPSYLNRMVGEASAAVRQEAVNAALGILSVARQVEGLFKQAKEATATAITSAISRLRTAENTCWDLIVQNVCTAAPAADKTCVGKSACAAGADPSTCTSPGTLRVATSTQFSQPIVTAQIAPLAIPVAQDIQKSDAALNQLDQLIASVTNGASATNQRQALERLDGLVANGTLHAGNDIITARSQTDAVTTDMNRLVEDTLALWGDSTDPNIGWCNVNNPSTLQRWISAWKI